MLSGILRLVRDATLGRYETWVIRARNPELYNYLVAFTDDDPHEQE